MWIFFFRALSNGQQGEVYEVNGDQVAVILDMSEDKAKEGEVKKPNDEHTEPPLYWVHGTIFILKLLKLFNYLQS